jgi:hypothetical protein
LIALTILRAEEILSDLRKEIAESNTLITLPPSKQSKFYLIGSCLYGKKRHDWQKRKMLSRKK